MKKPTLSRGKMKGHRATLIGGPWNKDIVFIPDGGTMVFSLPFNSTMRWHGHYNSDGRWVSADVQS